MLLREFFWRGPAWRRAFAYFGLVGFIGMGVVRAWIQKLVTDWYRSFYDVAQTIVSTDDTGLADGRDRVLALLADFVWLVLPLVVLEPLAGWLTNRWILSWRMALVGAYLDGWDPVLRPIEGAAQRIQEDTMRFAQGVNSAVVAGLSAVLSLIVFSPVH
jgi:peptide/bleomycin uptake transporter